MELIKHALIGTLIFVGFSALPAQSQGASITLDCSPGLCIVSVNAPGATPPIKTYWNIDVGNHNVIFPGPCDLQDSCVFICPGAAKPWPVTFPTTASVNVYDGNNNLIGGASTFTGCAAQVW